MRNQCTFNWISKSRNSLFQSTLHRIKSHQDYIQTFHLPTVKHGDRVLVTLKWLAKWDVREQESKLILIWKAFMRAAFPSLPPIYSKRGLMIPLHSTCSLKKLGVQSLTSLMIKNSTSVSPRNLLLNSTHCEYVQGVGKKKCMIKANVKIKKLIVPL